MLDPDTIVAVSTPPGRGGIGIVRLSGPRAVEIVSPLLRLNHPLAPNRARFGHLLDLTVPQGFSLGSPTPAQVEGAGSPRLQPRVSPGAIHPSNLEPRTSNLALDEIVATFFAAPHSYTAEDLVEIAAHGSPVLLEHIVRQCCLRGARLAEPGEFTQRAFLAGRIDLTQAEAVADLIASSTLEQARLAARQLSGSLAHSIAPIKEHLVALIATLEAGIDFAEDDIDVLPAPEISARIAQIHAPLESLERTFATGRVIRDGFKLAIVGRPNAGKSSLFNQLVQRDRAIVTASPGTTRDLVTETIAIDGIPVHLIDTAGLRDSSDEAEALGIAKSHQAIADADVVLLVLDAPALAANSALAPEDLAILARHAAEDQAVPTAPAPPPGSSSGLQPAESPQFNQPGFSPGILAPEDKSVILSEGVADTAVEGPPHLSFPTPATLLLALNKIDLLPNQSQIKTFVTNLLQSRLQFQPPAQMPPVQKSTTAPIPQGFSLGSHSPQKESRAGSPRLQPRVSLGAIHPSNLEPRTSNLEATSNLEPRTSNLIETSALTGLGIPALRAAIVAAVAGPSAAPREAAMLTNLRQHQAVQQSLSSLIAAQTAVAARIPHEMLLLDLYAALRALDSLTGATTTEDLLRLIFSTFCIGK